MRRGWPAVAGMLALGCDTDSALRPTAPQIVAVTVTANEENVLSAIVSARVRFADSVAVRYRVDDIAPQQTTPAVTPSGEDAVVPVLGLLPETHYAVQVVAYGGSVVVADAEVPFSTGALPTDLPQYRAGGADPSPGFVAFGAGMYGLVIDNSGRVVWYRRFPNGPGLNFQVQPTGRYYARPVPADAAAPAVWMEIDPLGRVARTFGCAGGLSTRFHDLIAELDGSVWLLCDEIRTMDLSEHGGVAGAQVIGTVVQHLGPEGALRFQWSVFDHFAITDLPLANRTGATVNWTHGNALARDPEGNLLVSFRSLSELTKIDTRTGDVLWRMGGLANQFNLQGTPLPAFARQHGLRVTDGQSFILLDNSGDPSATRAERYRYDAAARRAWLVNSYGSLPTVIAELGGTTQALPGGRILVAYGNGGRVEEYDSAGAVVWRIEGDPGYVFRAQRIWSLYRPGVL